MTRSLKALLLTGAALGSLAATVALVAPARANAQGFGVAVQFGNAYPAAYGPGYENRFYADHLRRDDWRRHEEWVRQQEWLRHREWERAHSVYGRPPYTHSPFGYYNR